MILLVYLVGVVLSFYIGLVLLVRSSKIISGDWWFEEIVISDIIVLTITSLTSFIGVSIFGIVLVFDPEYGVLSNTDLKLSGKVKKFIDKITF